MIERVVLAPSAVDPADVERTAERMHTSLCATWILDAGIMSALVDVPLVQVSIMTVELAYRARRETLLSLMKAKPLPKRQLERIGTFLSVLDKRNGLRNAIAHQVWKSGKRSGSIRPVGISVRGGEVTFKGLLEGEDDYTADKLRRIANELARSYDKFVAYLDRDYAIRPH
jgi:hypothetical protein